MAPLTSRVAGAAARMLLKSATVTAVADHGPLRTLELTGRPFEGANWVPGDKLRVHLEGFDLRTYTPTAWDAQAGRTQILAFDHGGGPGSAWCRQAAVGDSCLVLGPQRSIRLDQCASAPILVGDETSFGLSGAWRTHRPGDLPAAELFEVSDPGAVEAGLAHHGIVATDLVERRPDDAHLPAFVQLVAEQVRAHPDAPVCLTGRAQTIAAVRRHLKAEGLRASDTKVKAYWDPNRSGLD